MPKLPSLSKSVPMPVVQLGTAKIAPFKDHIPPYGAFANTTPTGTYPIVQTTTMDGKPLNIKGKTSITWPSSEHAYHAQKLLAYKQSLPDGDPKIAVVDSMLDELSQLPRPPKTVFLPSNATSQNDPDTYAGLVNKYLPQLGFPTKNDFDEACKAGFHPIHKPHSGINPATNLPYTYDYMKFSVQMKLEQHPELKEMAKEFARSGVMPMEISQHDQTWASFKAGEGRNYLGLIILELGNEYLKKEDHVDTPPIPKPHEAYAAMQASPDVAKLGYANLGQYVNASGTVPMPAAISPVLPTEPVHVDPLSLPKSAVLHATITPSVKTPDKKPVTPVDVSLWVNQFFAQTIFTDSKIITSTPDYKGGRSFPTEGVSVYHNLDDSITLKSTKPNDPASVSKLVELANATAQSAPMTVTIDSGSAKDILQFIKGLSTKNIDLHISPIVAAQLKDDVSTEAVELRALLASRAGVSQTLPPVTATPNSLAAQLAAAKKGLGDPPPHELPLSEIAIPQHPPIIPMAEAQQLEQSREALDNDFSALMAKIKKEIRQSRNTDSPNPTVEANLLIKEEQIKLMQKELSTADMSTLQSIKAKYVEIEITVKENLDKLPKPPTSPKLKSTL